jgi:hypothetical protein
MPFYASFNIALSLCMIMAVIALLVGRSQCFASPHFVLSMSSTRASMMLAVRLMLTVQLGTPRGRYDEYSSMVFPQ